MGPPQLWNHHKGVTMATRVETGKVGKYLYVIVDRSGCLVYTGLVRWEAIQEMRQNNGSGRGWSMKKFVAEVIK